MIDASAAILIGLLASLPLQSSLDHDTADGIFGLLIVAAWVLVTAGVSAVTHGQTLGKRVAGIRVTHFGTSAGFWRIVLRDSVCGLLYLVPFFFLVNACFPLGEDRRSVIDRMVNTDVVETDRIKGRIPLIIGAAVVGVGAWVTLTTAHNFDAHYSRAEFVSGCASRDTSAAFCGCLYDQLKPRVSRDHLDKLVTAQTDNDIDRAFAGARAAVAAAGRACATYLR